MKEGFRVSGLAIAAGAAVIVVALVIGAMALFGFGLFNRATADFRGTNQQIEKTRASGDYRIASYEHFFNQCVAVQNDEAQIASLKEELRTKPPADREMQVQASLTALRGSRASKINQYNADAQKEGTQGQFRSSDLPYRLDATKEETQCSV